MASPSADAILADPDNAAPARKPVTAGLYLVATPIGNLRDITLRALDVLQAADLIACEDTRVAGKLLRAFGLRAKSISYHDHNGDRQRPLILDALRAGQVVALIPDAGTPLISDPGYKLVQAAVTAGLPVTALPGASAALTALQLSALPPDRFLFAGFPGRGKSRRAGLQALRTTPASLIFYESSHRLADSLAEMHQVFGDRPAAVARELTKLHEEVRRDSLAALAAYYADAANSPKGEIVVVIGPPDPASAQMADCDATALLQMALAGGLRLRDAVDAVAGQTGLARRRVYRLALSLNRDDASAA